MTEASSTSQQTAKQVEKENRQIITPYAFQVSAELFGKPLASPTRRGLAILIDLILIGLLSGVTGNALAVLSAALLLFVSRRLKRKGKPNSLVILLRILSLILILLAVFGFYDQFQSRNDPVTKLDKSANKWVALALGTKYVIQANDIADNVSSGECVSTLKCWEQLGAELTDDLVSSELTPSEVNMFIEEFTAVSRETLSPEEAKTLEQQILTDYQRQYNPTKTQDEKEPGIVVAAPFSQPDESKYSILNWIKGLAAEFGIGFGWAALYFTALTGLLKGQTLGKKLLGIKIIKLDGSAMSTWESFGRYGGYGAGLATGLMGFLQIYWDPNRQAIQDKISETLVVDIRKSRIAKLAKMKEA